VASLFPTLAVAGVRRHTGVSIQQIAAVAPKAASADVTPLYQTMVVLQVKQSATEN
jgi:hypothetical protein